MGVLTKLPRFAVITSLAVAVSACLPTGGEDRTAIPMPMDAVEISQRLSDNSVYRSGWRGLANWEYASHHSADGRMSARAWWFGGRDEAEGRWEVTSDGLYCRTWLNHWADGEKGCFRVFSSASDGTLIFDYVSGAAGDAKQYSYEVLAGNPYSL